MDKITEKSLLLKTTLEYLEAITNNDITLLPLSPHVKITNNGIQAKIGTSNIWGLPRRIPFRQTFVDPETGSAVFFGIITNTTTIHAGFEAKWWRYVVRLKVEQSLITEIEEIIFDSIFTHYETNPWELRPNIAFNYVLPIDERSTRDELISLVDCYWNAVERSIDGFSIPFHPDAIRNECGTITTDAKNFPNSARGDFTKAKNEGWRWDVLNRRFPVVDVDRGVVVSIVDLTTTDKTNPNFLPCIVAEIFKIENGLLKNLFAFFYIGDNRSDW
jgi:hypothetical protein